MLVSKPRGSVSYSGSSVGFSRSNPRDQEVASFGSTPVPVSEKSGLVGEDTPMSEDDEDPGASEDALKEAAQAGVNAVNTGLFPDEGADAPKPISSMGPPSSSPAGVAQPAKPATSEMPETTPEAVDNSATSMLCFVFYACLLT